MKPTPTFPANSIGQYLACHGDVVRDQAHCNHAVGLRFHGDGGVRTQLVWNWPFENTSEPFEIVDSAEAARRS